jgi:amino acid adenylation domain-containing protein/non-ribosomal peptide synthase protein (TIGR01720 family)
MDRIKRKIIEEYWTKKMSHRLSRLSLPLRKDLNEKDAAGQSWASAPLTIPGAVATKLKTIAKSADAALFILFLSGVNITLGKYTGIDDLVVGTTAPAAGGNHSPVFCRTHLPGCLTVKEAIQRTTQEVREAFNYSEYSLAVINGQNPTELFKVAVIYDHFQEKDQALESFEQVLVLSGQYDQLDLYLEVNYLPDVFSQELSFRFCRHVIRILEIIAGDIGRKISRLEILSEEEKKEILEDFNNTEVDFPGTQILSRLFEKQVERTPDSMALISIINLKLEYRNSSSFPLTHLPNSHTSHISITYRELAEKSRQWAEELRQKGVGPDTIVGVLAERSLEMMVGIYGILKAGGAYLPIDPGYPPERIRYILADSGARVLLTAVDPPLRENVGQLSGLTLPVINLEEDPAAATLTTTCQADPGNLAYIIYTSGSTGQPKGVIVEHRSVINRLNWMQRYYPLGPQDVILQKTPIVFDVSVWELFWWGFQGASLCLLGPGDEKSPAAIIKAVNEHQVTTMHFVPSMLNAFLHYLEEGGESHKLGTLRQVFASGESLLVHHARHFHRLLGKPRPALINLYGPTEATVDVSHYPCGETSCWEIGEAETIPIGKPIDNLRLYVADDQGHLQPVGVAGQLLISGTGLARGYLNNIDLTAEKFTAPPFAPGQRLYRSGDLARWRTDGNIEFLGRIDHQVKIRGFRIEPTEIENHLLKHRETKEVIVTAREDGSGDKYLCAYMVLKSSKPTGSTDLVTTKARGLRKYLETILPAHMIPSYFLFLEQLPATSTGKVDHKALPDPKAAGTVGVASNTDYTAPVNIVEKTCVKVWEEVLGHKSLGTTHNFFALGGDSIKAIQTISRLNRAGYGIELKHIFRNPTISQLAPLVKKIQRTADQAAVLGTVPLTPIQHWFFENRWVPDGHHFNQAVMISAREGFDEAAIRVVFTKIQQHHDALRMTFPQDKKGKIQQVNQGPDHSLSLQVFDLRNREDAGAALEREVKRIQAGIDLGKGPLMKLGLFHLDDGDRLLIVVHHLVIDGVSWRILWEDIETLYRHYREYGSLDTVKLPMKTDSFKVWAEGLVNAANSEVFLKEIVFWGELKQKAMTTPPIPRDFEEEYYMADNANCHFRLSREETRQLLTRVNEAYGTEINDILITALGLAIVKTFGPNCHRLLLALEGHGRETVIKNIDISRTVGWFTSLFPVVLDFTFASGNPGPALDETEVVREDCTENLSRQLKKVKETLRRIPRKGIGYGILRYLIPPEHLKGKNFHLTPPVIFNYLGQFDADQEQKSFTIAEESPGNCQGQRGRGVFQLDVSGMIADNQLTITISYSRKQYKAKTVETLLAHYEKELKRIICHCLAQPQRLWTPSDFTYKNLTLRWVEELTLQTNVEDIYILTPLQEAMLYHWLAEPSSIAYFQQISYRLRGSLDMVGVEKSLEELFKRREVLRTTFRHEGLERPVQVVLKDRPIDFTFKDIRSWEPGDQDGFIYEFKKKDRQRRFDLTRDVLMRVAVVQLKNAEYEFTWSHHHILMDGWCIGILISEFFEIYTSCLEKRTHGLPPVHPYRNYIQWWEEQDRRGSLRYWQNYLAGFKELSGFPRGTAAESKEEYIPNENKQLIFSLPGNLSTGLGQLAVRNQVTLNTLLQALWGILLSRCSGKQDVVFGAAVSGRPPAIEGVESMVGLFITTIPIRIRCNPDLSFKQLLQQLQQEAIASEPHHHCPLVDIQSQWTRETREPYLFDHVMVFVNYPVSEQIKSVMDKNQTQLPLVLSNLEIFEQDNYPFLVTIAPGERLSVRFGYNPRVYDGDFIHRLKDYFNEIAAVVLENTDTPVRDIQVSHVFIEIPPDTCELEEDFEF